MTAVQIERQNPDVQPCMLLCKATLSADGDPAKLQWSADGNPIGNTELLTVQDNKGLKSYTCTASNPVSSSHKTVPMDSLCQGKGTWHRLKYWSLLESRLLMVVNLG